MNQRSASRSAPGDGALPHGEDLPEIFTALARSENTACLLTRERRLVRTNEGWVRFAQDNGGEEVLRRCQPGFLIDDVIPEPLRELYASGFERALATNTPWAHDYDCSSAEAFRRFRMLVYPVKDAFVVVHSKLVEAKHKDEVHHGDRSLYSECGVICMCSHCRRTRFPNGRGRWDWVPSFVASPPANLSHGLCEPCVHFHYPGL